MDNMCYLKLLLIAHRCQVELLGHSVAARTDTRKPFFFSPTHTDLFSSSCFSSLPSSVSVMLLVLNLVGLLSL